MFSGCKKLNGYERNDGNFSYIIPEEFFSYAPNIENLTGAFQYMLFPSNVSLDVFEPLKKTLNLNTAFFGSVFGDYTEASRCTIGYIFKNKNITDLYGVFANSITNSGASTTDVGYNEYAQHVTFDSVFDSKYGEGSYRTNPKFTYAFSGYLEDNVVFENKSLWENNTNNYAVVVRNNN